ncbi:beta-ketoacyl-ACP synthase II [Luoshenia tenuis]|jgi:3-oxoacyl-[acyl-carrier-protein] synthase II|uniref:beta-ketoacyl-ACP synthase II n=1 Tax=Luoshenia tenuis TaxID=2763654 RepID=UPI003D8CA103
MKRVAITGLGVITPVGNDVNTFWENLTAGVCGIGPITKFPTDDLKVKIAAEVKDFDPAAFGMDVPTARKLDLYTQYALAAAKQAVEDSGIAESGLAPERFGVYVGSGIGGMNTFVNETQKLMQRGPSRVSPFFIPMMIGNIAAGNIAIQYGAQGPCLPVVTACATSTHAVGEAYRAIAGGYADAIIAGGSEATINPLAVAGFTNCMALAVEEDPHKASLPFDKRRKGFVMGEGAGILILEEMERARARGAKIYGEICGYANTCDAYHVTAPHPEGLCASRAIAMAASEAGIRDEDTVYINAHGTGTPMNDSSETLAIKKALGEDMARRAMISSTKSITGHMLGAAGAVEAAASTLALHRGVIPPTINLEEPDPACDLDYVPGSARKAQATLALSVSLGFGGHNGCIAIRPVDAEVK